MPLPLDPHPTDTPSAAFSPPARAALAILAAADPTADQHDRIRYEPKHGGSGPYLTVYLAGIEEPARPRGGCTEPDHWSPTKEEAAALLAAAARLHPDLADAWHVSVRTMSGNPIVTAWRQFHAGHVLETYERNGYDDSDWYALYWDADKEQPGTYCYASTRGWTYQNGAVIDASPEDWAAFREWARRGLLARLQNEAAEEARRPDRVGRRVTVTSARSRKVPPGTTGTVTRVMESDYAPRYATGAERYRVAIRDDAGAIHWTSAHHCTVIDPQDYLPDLADLERRAASFTATANARSLYAAPSGIAH